MTADRLRSRPAPLPIRCENAFNTFRRAEGLANQNGDANPTPIPYAIS
jgi:hypothetical protein